jgi:hypothetical protein
MDADTLSVVTVDPSPTKYWALQAWLVHWDSEQRILLDTERRVMEAPELLDWNYQTSEWFGLLEDFRRAYASLGRPLRVLIVEQNAAQRFLLQFGHFKRWTQRWNIRAIGHSTFGKNKLDPEYGVATIGPHYENGRVRLPGHNTALGHVNWLVNEVLRYPEGQSDDQVMAHWFLEANLDRVKPARVDSHVVQWRPSWLAAYG